MSLHPVRVPSREELVATYSKPLPKGLGTLMTVLAVLGLLVFIAGLLVAPDRAWRAYHFNWLYFTSLSSAGVMFVAVQRITTARWSRPIVRLLEGYVAFLPVAFVLLLVSLFIGKGHIFPWTHERPPVAEKVLWYNAAFLSTRAIISFGAITLLSLWYIYTSVRLDVGLLPEWGANWAAGLRARMRAGFGEERRELHSTHSLQGKLAVFLALSFGYGWSLLAFDLSMGLSLHFQSTLYGEVPSMPFGLWEIGVTLGFVGLWGTCYLAFMNAFPRVRAVLMTSPYRDEVQVPVNPETMEPLPAHE